MLTFYLGTLEGVDVVAVYSGVCKVNAAVAAQILADAFPVSAIFVVGTAGGTTEDGQLFDTVISRQVVYHDVADDILTEYHPWMPTSFSRRTQSCWPWQRHMVKLRHSPSALAR